MTIKHFVRSCLACSTILLVAMFGMSVQAQDAPAPEHDFLKKFAGEWVSKSKSIAVENMPAMECSGTSTYRMLGDYWIVAELTGDFGGATMNAVQTIGYDSKKQKYVGTWVDSMMNHMWHYEGTVDEGGNKLVLEAEGPNFASHGKTAKFRDSYEFKSADHIIATSMMQDESGKWITFMVGDVTRKK